MSIEETQQSAKKRHKVGHDISQVHFSSKQEIEEYYDELSCACWEIQVSANPDMLEIQDSMEMVIDQEDPGYDSVEAGPTLCH